MISYQRSRCKALDAFGEVVHVYLHVNWGYALVRFADVESAVGILRQQVIHIGGEEVKVTYAKNSSDSSIEPTRVGEGGALTKHCKKMAEGFREDRSDLDVTRNLLSFFEGQISQEAVDFVNSLTPAATSKLMKRVVAATKSGDKEVISRVRLMLDSGAARDSIDVESWADEVTREAVAKHLKKMGGEDDLGTIGGRLHVKKGELKELGFNLTPRGTVTAFGVLPDPDEKEKKKGEAVQVL